MQALGVALWRSAARRGVERRDSRRFLPRCTSRVRRQSFIHLTSPLLSPPPGNRWSTFPEANSNNNIVKCFSNRAVQMVQGRHDTARPRRPSHDHVIPANRGAIPANRFCNIHTEYEPPQK